MSDVEIAKELADKIGARIKEVISEFEADISSANCFIKVKNKVNLTIYKGSIHECVFNNCMERVNLDQSLIAYMSGDK